MVSSRIKVNLVVKEGAMGPRVDLKLVGNFYINQLKEVADVKEPAKEEDIAEGG